MCRTVSILTRRNTNAVILVVLLTILAEISSKPLTALAGVIHTGTSIKAYVATAFFAQILIFHCRETVIHIKFYILSPRADKRLYATTSQ